MNRARGWVAATVVALASVARGAEVDTLLAQGKDAVSVGRWKEAARIFDRALSIAPGQPEALYGSGWAALQLGKRKLARQRFEDVLRQTHANPAYRGFHTLALSRIAEMLVGDRHYDEAIGVFEQGLKNEPENVELLYGYGTALRARGQNEKALGRFEAALKLNPRHPGALVGKAAIYYELGNVPEAFRLLEAAVQAAPSNPLAYGVIGALYEDMKKPEDARLMLGHYYFYAGDLKQAANAYRSALAIKESPEAYQTLGSVKLQQGLYREAEELFRKALDLKLKPAAVGHAQLAHALAKQGRVPDALVSLRRALKEDPRQPGYWAQLAWIALMQGDKAESERAARKSIELDPNQSAGYRYLGDVLSAQGKYTDAIGAYEKALSREPNLPDVYVNLGWAYESTGDLVTAVRNYETFLTVSDDKDVNEKVRGQIKLLKSRQRPGK